MDANVISRLDGGGATSSRGTQPPHDITVGTGQRIEPNAFAGVALVGQPGPGNRGSALGQQPAAANRLCRPHRLERGDTPHAFVMSMADGGGLQIVPARLATPLTEAERRAVQTIFAGQFWAGPTLNAQRGNRAVLFSQNEWQGSLIVGAWGGPVSLKAFSSEQKLELRWTHPSNDQWLQFASQTKIAHDYRSAVRGFMQGLSTRGDLHQFLLNLDYDKPGVPPTPDCLRAVVLSMAGREDPTGQAVCDAVVKRGATPATLHLLDRADLVTVMKLPELRFDLSDLRWWPPACVGQLIDELLGTRNFRYHARSLFSEIYRGSEPPSIGTSWPEVFTAGIQRMVAPTRLHAPQLWFLHRRYLAHTDCPEKQSRAVTVLRVLENAYSVADMPRTMRDVSNLSRQDLSNLGLSRTCSSTLCGPTGLLSWLSDGQTLEALEADFAKWQETDVLVPEAEQQEFALPDLAFTEWSGHG